METGSGVWWWVCRVVSSADSGVLSRYAERSVGEPQPWWWWTARWADGVCCGGREGGREWCWCRDAGVAGGGSQRARLRALGGDWRRAAGGKARLLQRQGRAGAAGERCAWRVRQASDRRGRKAGRAGGEREGGSGGCSDDQPGAVTSQHTVCSMNSLLLCSLPTDAGQFTRYTAAAHIIRKQGYRRQQRSSALSLSRALHRCLVTPPGA